METDHVNYENKSFHVVSTLPIRNGNVNNRNSMRGQVDGKYLTYKEWKPPLKDA